MEQLANLLLG